MRLPPPFVFLACSLSRGHLGVKLEQLFQPLGIVAEAAADIDALQHLVVALMRLAQVGGHVLGIIEIGDRRREMRLARQQDVLGAAGQVGLVLLGERGDGKGVPAESVGIARSPFSSATDRCNPDQMQAREAIKRHIPKWRIVQRKALIRRNNRRRWNSIRQADNHGSPMILPELICDTVSATLSNLPKSMRQVTQSRVAVARTAARSIFSYTVSTLCDIRLIFFSAYWHRCPLIQRQYRDVPLINS